MLSRSSQISRNTSLPALESVHSLQEYLPDVQPDSNKEFPDISDEDSESDEKQGSPSDVATEIQNDGASDFTALMPTKDFGELFEQFFVDDHKQLFTLRSKILLEKDGHSSTFLPTSEANIEKLQELRTQLYKLQLVIFQHPKGREFDIAR